MAVTLGLRAEALRLVPSGLAAVAEHMEYLGTELLLHARLADGTAVAARLPAASGVQAGDTVHLDANWSGALLFGPDGARMQRQRAMAHV